MLLEPCVCFVYTLFKIQVTQKNGNFWEPQQKLKKSKKKNLLTEIDISNNTELENLIISNNFLTTLDVSNNPSLWQLDVRRNYFASVEDIYGLQVYGTRGGIGNFNFRTQNTP